MTHDELVHVSVWVDMISRLATMFVIWTAIVCSTVLLGRIAKKERPWGVIIFGSLLILGSIYKLQGFWEYNYYRFMFQQLAEQTIFMRYCCSVVLRLAGIIIAVGVLLLKDSFRKILLALCLMTFFFLYWKHPFFVFENIARRSEQILFNKPIVTELAYPMYPWISLVFNYTVDIIFSGSMFYYFTRPKVREQFH